MIAWGLDRQSNPVAFVLPTTATATATGASRCSVVFEAMVQVQG